MNETNTKATYYFQSYQNYFWQWEIDYMFSAAVIEDAQDYQGGINCISIPDGMTIAYKEQLEEVLQAISSYELPPFGALVLAFLATNAGEVSIAIDEIFTNIKDIFEDELIFKHVYFEDAQRFLNNLISLPAEFKKGKNRIDLFTFLFQDVHHGVPSTYTDEILRGIKNDAFELNACSHKAEITMSALSKDFNALALLHGRYPTVDALLKAWGKIVPVAIDAEDIDIEYFSDDPDLVQELIEEPKTFFMGSLIKRLWSGINLPMHYVHPGEMPLGGISDVTNKGNFDNLLISEFANDDLIFLHRIANKEALFIRRETTPEEDLRTRIFLIDTTIKNWGTPKILSFATAFSFIHHPKNEMNFKPYAIGDTYQTVDFDSKLAIIEGLQMTSPLLDAADAIIQFIEETEEENIEITLFTSPKTLEHASMRKVFNLHHDKFGGVITTDIDGTIEVYKMKNGAKRLVKHIQLPLAELWAHPPRTKHRNGQQLTKNVDHESVVNYPLLYGYPIRGVVHFIHENHNYTALKNGELFKSTRDDLGFQMVQNNLRFFSGIKQQLYGILYEGEFMVMYWNSMHQLIFKTQSAKYTFKGDFKDDYNASHKHLLQLDEEIYLITKSYYNAEYNYTKFDLHNRTYIKINSPSRTFKQSLDKHLKRSYNYFSGSVLSNIHQITITSDLNIIFNRSHQIKFIDNSIHYKKVNMLEYSHQESDTFVFHKKNKTIEFYNGSKIIIDRNGMIIFESALPAISTFYLSSYIGIGLAMATEDEFTGNPYFLPENSTANKISPSVFQKKHVEPFLLNILNS